MAPLPPDGNNQASRPGVEFIRDDEASRFNERIAEKQRGGASVARASKDGHYDAVIDVDEMASNNQKTATTGPSSSSKIDQDMQAKQRAKGSAFMKVAPGAQAVRNVESSASGTLDTLDRDIGAKNRARRSFASPGGEGEAKKVAAAPSSYSLSNNNSNSNSKSSDADTAAKNQARSSGPAMIPGAFSAPNQGKKPAPTMAASNSNDSAAKDRARSTSGPAMIPGAFESKNEASSAHGHKDIVFGGGEVYGSSRKVPALGLDKDTLAKQSAAAPRYITLEEGSDDPLAQKKMDAAKSGVGAGAAYGGNPGKKDDGGTSRPGMQISSNEEAAYINHKLGRYNPVDGQMQFGQMQFSIDDAEFQDMEDNKLAVATAVEEEEEDIFIPAAIEYDPDAKPPLHKNRRFRLYSVLGVVMLIVAVTAIVIPTQVVQDDDLGPTLAPTTFREGLGIIEQIEKYVGSANLYDGNSSHYKALDWLLHEDPAELSPDAENLLQRYILAFFYFHTSEKGPWRSCNAPTVNETSDCQYQRIDDFWPELTFELVPWGRWLSELHECSWAGVYCERNKTTALEIQGQKLSGNFPEELSHLPFLRSISFPFNEFSGTFPASLASTMKHLTSIELQTNFLTGTLPVEMFAFENLIRVNLGENMLTGPLRISPDSKVDNLKGFFIYDNDFTGTIPSELFRFHTLSYLRLSKNNFTGPLPTEIGLLSNLQEIWAHRTFLEGTIPSEIGALSRLLDLRVYATDMTGTIPDELYNLEKIDRIDLYDAGFSGTISTRVGELTTLDVLRISDNDFTGDLPSELGLLTQLQLAWFHNNRLEGEVPAGLCEQRQDMVLLDLSADCHHSENPDSALVQCPCCTACCEPETQTCVAVFNE